MLRCRNIIVDVAVTWGATSEGNVDGISEGNKREQDGECKMREEKHGGEGGGAAEVNEKMKERMELL